MRPVKYLSAFLYRTATRLGALRRASRDHAGRGSRRAWGARSSLPEDPWLMTVRAFMLVCSSLLLQLALSSLPLAENNRHLFCHTASRSALGRPTARRETPREKHGWPLWPGSAAPCLSPGREARWSARGWPTRWRPPLCYAFYQILTRKLATTEPVMRQLFYTALVGSIAMSFLLPGYWTGEIPTLRQAMLIISLGIFAGTGHFLLIRAYRETGRIDAFHRCSIFSSCGSYCSAGSCSLSSRT